MVEARARHQELAEFSLAQAARWIEKDLGCGCPTLGNGFMQMILW